MTPAPAVVRRCSGGGSHRRAWRELRGRMISDGTIVTNNHVVDLVTDEIAARNLRTVQFGDLAAMAVGVPDRCGPWSCDASGSKWGPCCHCCLNRLTFAP